MKEHPILFNTEMVKAVLSGKKTQTRRLLKSQPDTSLWKPEALLKEKEWRKRYCMGPGHHIEENMWCLYNKDDSGGAVPYTGEKCPFGEVGDSLWVRETFKGYGRRTLPPKFFYRASDPDVWPHLKWTPSIHMPREASRINLGITDIRVERLQDITYIEAKAEGVNYERGYTDPRDAFKYLWDSIYKNWDDNPWVWVVEFKVI